MSAVAEFARRLAAIDDPKCEEARAIRAEVRAAGLENEVLSYLRRWAQAQQREADALMAEVRPRLAHSSDKPPEAA